MATSAAINPASAPMARTSSRCLWTNTTMMFGGRDGSEREAMQKEETRHNEKEAAKDARPACVVVMVGGNGPARCTGDETDRSERHRHAEADRRNDSETQSQCLVGDREADDQNGAGAGYEPDAQNH